MYFRTTSPFLIAGCLALAVAASAAEPETAAPESARPSTEKSAPEIQPVPRTPMAREIDTLLNTARSAVDALQERFDRATDSESALDLVRQIELMKTNTELDILRVQLKYARAGGNAELAQELTAALRQMTTPRPRGNPVDRTATDADNH